MRILGQETREVLQEVARERADQDFLWGRQNHPNGTGSEVPIKWGASDFGHAAFSAKRRTDKADKAGEVTFEHILTEEVYEAYAEDDDVPLRKELIQVAAVAVAWIEAIDRRAVKNAVS